MWLSRLSLHNYRNYLQLELDLQPGLNLFIGSNAQGKTNLLEACHVLATARSHRTSREMEMIRWEQQSFHIGAIIHTRHGTRHLDLRYDAHKSKQVQIDGVRMPRLFDLIGQLNVVFFAPEHLALVKADPSQRRRFIDILLSQLYHKYLYQLSQYQKLLRSKSELLKTATPDLELLQVFNIQLAELGAAIILRRIMAVQTLNSLAARYHLELHPEEHLQLSYQNQLADYNNNNIREDKIASDLLALFAQKQSDELRRRICLVGPHRDDILFSLNGEDARKFASQGQQRSIVLALKVAEAHFMDQISGERPLLILDDLFSELDPERQLRLINLLQNFGQTLISAVQLPSLFHTQEKSIFQVKEGRVNRLSY